MPIDASMILLYVSDMSKVYTITCCRVDFSHIAVGVGCLDQIRWSQVDASG